MSIKSHIEDAEYLWSTGRVEAAWTHALIATAATARKRYPKPMSDNQSFKAFVRDISGIILSGDINSPGPISVNFYKDHRGDGRSLDELLYVDMRCNLLHEAKLDQILLSKSAYRDGQLAANLTVPGRGRGEIPDFWVLHLILAIKAAKENASE